MKKLAPSISTFKSPGGRTFRVEKGELHRRWKDDPLWSEMWKIEYRDRGEKRTDTMYFEDGKDSLDIERVLKGRNAEVFARFKVPYDSKLRWSRAPGMRGKLAR